MLRLEPCTNEYRTSFTLVSTLSTLRLKLLPMKNSSQKSEHQTFIHENSIGHLANVDLKLWVGRYRVAKKKSSPVSTLGCWKFCSHLAVVELLNLEALRTHRTQPTMSNYGFGVKRDEQKSIYIYIRWPNVSSSYAQAHDEPDFRISTSFWPHLNDSSTCVYQILSSFRCPKDA